MQHPLGTYTSSDTETNSSPYTSSDAETDAETNAQANTQSDNKAESGPFAWSDSKAESGPYTIAHKGTIGVSFQNANVGSHEDTNCDADH